MSTSQLYAVLNRLNEDGAVTGKRQTPIDGPPRIQYTITPKGQSKLNSWLLEPNPSSSIHNIRVMFLSRLYIADLLNVPSIRIFDNQIASCRLQFRKLSRKKREINSPIEEIALDYVLNQLTAVLNWLEDKKFLLT